MKDHVILAIESSCDETAAAVVKNGREVLSSAVYTQIPIHQKFGGVVPEVASRNHTLKINSVTEKALSDAGLTFKDITAVGVTYGAGLSGALLVGISYAKAVAYSLSIPLIGVNHIRGHIAANYIADKTLEPPFICLVVSGGHTAILDIPSFSSHEIMGSTADDAAGEAFDKVARVLGLPYPGGPNVEKLAKEGKPVIKFPSAGIGGYNFSYSGLKTAVINHIHNSQQKGIDINAADICASFSAAALDTLCEKGARACKERGRDTFCIAGGVSANSYLREKAAKVCQSENLKLCVPPLSLCTDNAAMIGAEAYFSYVYGNNTAGLDLNAVPDLKL